MTSYLWDYEERQRQVIADEYQADTAVVVDEFLRFGKNMLERKVSLQMVLNVVAYEGKDTSNSVQHF